ncbi:MAG: Mini-ribonuclease 3 [Bacillota bacterium]
MRENGDKDWERCTIKNDGFLPEGASPASLPPLILAYIGDAVYELHVRKHLVQKGLIPLPQLHRKAVEYVRATTQAMLVQQLASSLTDEEKDLIRRGRNAKSGHGPKSANVMEYRYSTGLEALIGYLYLQGNQPRLEAVLGLMMQVIEKKLQERSQT